MARSPMRRLFLRAFSLGLELNAALTRSRFKALEGVLLTPLFVRLTRLVRGTREVAPTVTALVKFGCEMLWSSTRLMRPSSSTVGRR